jgi:hypothetical protein
VTAATIDGYVLAAIGIAAIVFILVVAVAARLLGRDPQIRVARWGMFVERERFDDEADPAADETQEWPAPKEPTDFR